jgi:hypothetical protein
LPDCTKPPQPLHKPQASLRPPGDEAVRLLGGEPNQAVHAGDAGVAAVLGAVAAALLVAANVPHLRTYTVAGDDYALILHSARQFAPSPVEWITRGYADYFISVPEFGGSGSNFIRPTVNATVFLESLAIADPFSPWFLATNYLGHAIVVALTYLLARRFAGLDHRWAILAAAIFFGTVSTTGLFFSVAFRADMLGTLLAVAALLVAACVPRTGHLIGAAAVAVLLTLAAFSKEAAVAAPLVLGVWWLQNAAGVTTSRLRHVYQVLCSDKPLAAALVLPLVLYAMTRLHAGLDGIYAMDDLPGAVFGIPMAVLNPLRFFSTAFVPVETDTIKAVLGGAVAPVDAFRAALALTINAGAWVSLAWLTWKRKAHSLLRVLVLGLVASAVPIIVKADPRFMYFGQTFMAPLLVGAVCLLYRERVLSKRSVSLVAAVLVLASPVGQLAESVSDQTRRVDENTSAREFQAAVLSALRDPRLRRLYVVNARDAGQAALEMLTARSRRDDVAARIVTTLSGVTVAAPTVGTTVFRQGSHLRVDTRYGPGQRPFGYVTPEGLRRLQASNAVAYGPITGLRSNPWGKQEVDQESLMVTLPAADRFDYALVGFDPGRDGVHVYTPASDRWQPFSPVAGSTRR